MIHFNIIFLTIPLIGLISDVASSSFLINGNSYNVVKFSETCFSQFYAYFKMRNTRVVKIVLNILCFKAIHERQVCLQVCLPRV